MRRNWAVIGLVIVAVYGVRLYSQGMASLGSPAAARMAPSGGPFAVSLVDVAAQLGLRARFVNGGEAAKQYIIEANGTGVAFLDFDNDGWDDVFLVNGSRTAGAAARAGGNYLFRNDHGKFLDVTKAARVNPKDFNTRYLLGTVFVRQDKTGDALRAWREALALQPGNAKLMQVMCVEYSKGRYFEEAARLAELALRGAPEDPSLYFLAMQARQDAGQHEEAFQWARRALEKFPSSARANFEVGFHLHKLGRWDEAMPYFGKAMAADPNYEEPYYFRGDVLPRRDQARRRNPSSGRRLRGGLITAPHGWDWRAH